MTTTYEWCVETKDEHGDIVDSDFRDKLAELTMPKENQDLVLIRYTGNEIEGETDRQWAYVKEGKLPDYFGLPTGHGEEYAETECRVPKRFKEELAKRTAQ